MLYFELRDIINVIADDLKHKAVSYEAKEVSHPFQHPRNLNKAICDGVEIGEIGLIHPTVAKKIDKKASIVYAELDINELAKIENASIKYEEPSKFPTIEIDLSFITKRFEPVAKAIKKANSPLIKSIEVTDVYEDENGKSITTRIVFSHPEKTLKREEVQEVADKIVADLKSLGIELKS